MDAPLPELPLGHVLTMIVSWTSMLLYGVVIFTILFQRRKHRRMRSSFYSLVVVQSVAEFALFLHFELLMRPRKYRFFNAFTELPSSAFLPRITYYLELYLRPVVALGYMPLALNRLAVFYSSTRFEKMWGPKMIISVAALQWGLPLIPLVIYFSTQQANIYFHLLPNGIMQMVADKYSTTLDFGISLVTHILFMIVCTTAYVAATVYAQKYYSAALKNRDYELRMLMVAIVSFLPLLLNVIVLVVRVYAVAVVPDERLFILFTDVNFYTSEMMSDVPPWVLMTMSPTFRRAVLESLPVFRHCAGKVKPVPALLLPLRTNTSSNDKAVQQISTVTS